MKPLLKLIGFLPEENTKDTYFKKYPTHKNYVIKVDFENEKFDFGKSITVENDVALNFSVPENWVTLECVDRLLRKGYKPQQIVLEKTWPSGHGTSGRLDICVTHDDGSEYLLIECKTFGKEFEKAFAKMKKDGGQLFTYFEFSRKADVIMLYASELKGKEIIYKNEIVKIEDDYRTGDVKDFYEKWNKLTKDNGVFDEWVKPYNFVSKALTLKQLQEIKQEDSGFIFNRFLEILRNNVVSDKGNAFNKIFTLFLCKVYDEKSTKPNEELKFQWLEGKDDDVSFQLRLTDLYKNGMMEFLEKQVTDFSEDEFENKYKNLSAEVKKSILEEIHKLRLEKNNEFAIKEVFDHQSFKENAKVVKQVVELLQGYRIRYNKRQQYLSDFFELLLTTGLKQESGQFFTPVPIAQFIIKSIPLNQLVDQKLEKGERNNLLPFIIDYAAGSGHFLTESMHEIQRLLDQKKPADYIPDTAKKLKTWQDDHFEWATNYVYGIEKDYRLVKVGKVGCYLHGDGLANVILSDGLGNFTNTEEYKGLLKRTDKDFPLENKQFDIVLSNPPYAVPAFKQTARNYYTEKDFEIYDKLTDNSSEIECLFIERTMQLLKDGGIAGIILPSSILSNTGIYTKAREIVLLYFDIIAIAELGSNTFMATGTNTVVLFLKRKSNYHHIHLKDAVNKFFTNMQDVSLNGIEKPFAKYVSYVWQNLSFADYTSLLQKAPNKAVTEHEIFIEYKKKIKAKNDSDFWDTLLEKEKEKLLYFIIAYPQKIVLVKTGEKEKEKQFLGYEFSNRRGSEGIHAMQRGKNIEECTQLFDPEIFDNPAKASTYIYKAFEGDSDYPVDQSLQQNVIRVNLVDMFTFDRVEFEKNISLSVKKKVKIESKWNMVRLGDICDLYQPKTITSQEIKDEGDFKVFGANGVIGYYDKYNHEDAEIAITCRGATCGMINLTEPKSWITGNAMVAKPKSNNVNKYFLLNILKISDLTETITGTAQPQITRTILDPFQIPLPPLNIQEKIVKEIEIVEAKEKKAKEELNQLEEEISSSIDKMGGENVKLQDITTKIGSGATPRGGESAYIEKGISLIRSQNIYDNEFVEKGLAFIDEKQAKELNNVTVEENDVLFNITGASVCRCCLVDKRYLPARVNQHVSIIRANNKVLPIYLQKVLISTKIKAELLTMAESSSTREAITKAQLEDFKIPLPPLSEQQKIVSFIQKIEEKIQKLQETLNEIPKQKEAVLKKYL